MASKITQLSPMAKVGLLIILIGAGALIWYLASPLFLDGPTLNEKLDDDVTILGEGDLVHFDSSHWGEGTVRLVNTSDGILQVQFDMVEIANGPGLVVYLSDKPSFSGIRDSPGQYVDLGDLPANIGTFSIDVSSKPTFTINSILIWCEPASVAFTYAPMN